MTVGVLHEGISSRSVFQTCSPVSADSASTNDSSCVSTWTITRPSQITGELAGPHSTVAAPAAPTLMRPMSTFHNGVPSTVYAWRPCDPNQATTTRPSVAGVELAYVDFT